MQIRLVKYIALLIVLGADAINHKKAAYSSKSGVIICEMFI